MATALPTWLMSEPNMSGLRKYVKDLPSQFDTSGVEQNYQGQMASNMARGTATSAAAARAAQNRAMRTGGQVASSFAQGSMMLPIFEQNQRMQGDLAQYKGGMQAQQSANRLSAIQAMAQLRAQQLGLRTNFLSDANRLGQQGDQFNANLDLEQDRFGEQQRQFDSGEDFRERQFKEQLRMNRLASASRIGGFGGGGGGGNQVWSPMMNIDRTTGQPMDQVSAQHMRMRDQLFNAQLNQMSGGMRGARPY